LKIALNCSYYGEKSGGIKEYIYNLVINLLKVDKENEYTFYVSVDDEEFWRRTMPKEAKYKIFPFKRDQQIKRSLTQDSFWRKEQQLEKFDIFHSPFFYVPKLDNCKTIMTVHDLRFRRYPNSYTFMRRHFVRYAFEKSLKFVDRIITVSEFTKSEIEAFYSYPSERIAPILEAVNYDNFLKEVDDTSILKELGLNKQGYLLSVGHIEPRKNYPLLIEAVDELNKDPKYSYGLVIVGKKNYKYQDSIEAINRSNNVKYLDFVSFDTLISLYKNALIHVFPSIYEGFGFPTLEAALFGVPSVISNVSSLPEMGGNSAVQIDPRSKTSLINGIKEAIDRRDELSILTKENLNRFSWSKTAEETKALYDEIVR
jgi:glycosyltransferase involved in cell wall biosynthesis